MGDVRVHSRSQICDKNGLYLISRGEQIGYRYIVEKVLDRGSFGQVCSCIDESTGTKVALKISSDKNSETKNATLEAFLL